MYFFILIPSRKLVKAEVVRHPIDDCSFLGIHVVYNSLSHPLKPVSAVFVNSWAVTCIFDVRILRNF
jgi:hypothetical protein